MCVSSRFCAILVVFCVVILEFAQPGGTKYEGDVCEDKYGSTGICVQMQDCPPALASVKLYKRHSYKRCSFYKFTEIVCCPKIDLKTTSTTEEYNPVWTKETTSSTENWDKLLTSSEEPITKRPVLQSRRKSIRACDEYSKKIEASIAYYIIDGENATEAEFPHMAALGYKTDQVDGELGWNCGGSLISPRYILTAAHCIINIEQNPPVKVRLGSLVVEGKNLTSNDKMQEYDIVNITVHPDYMWKEKFNDLALLKLDRNVTTGDSVQPACLYTKNDDPLGLIITGWGNTDIGVEGKPSRILQKAKLSPISIRECNQTFTTRAHRNIIPSQICAGDDTSDTCQGDSGGPLQVQNKANSSIYSIVGITSYGIGCGTKYPGIYTRVSSYLDWIEKIVWT